MGHLYIHHSDSLLRQQKLHQKIQMARGCQNTIPIAYTRRFWQRFPWGGFLVMDIFSWDNKKPQLYLHHHQTVGWLDHLPGWMPSNGMEAFLGQARWRPFMAVEFLKQQKKKPKGIF